MSTHNEKREALERNQHRLATDGLDAATEAAIQILRDPKAPSQARSATISAVFRAQGLFNQKDDPGRDKEAHEMTADEIDETLQKLETTLERARSGKGDKEDPFE